MLTSDIPHIFIKTVNTDALIIAIALILHLELGEMWIDLIMGFTESTYLVMLFTSNLDIIDQQELHLPTHLPKVTKCQHLRTFREKEDINNYRYRHR